MADDPISEPTSPVSEPSSSDSDGYPSLLTFTENNSATFSSSGDACVDFFFQIVPDTPAEKVLLLLDLAWKQDPITALKLVFQLRGVRGTGKSDKAAFYTCASWMHEHHPGTLLRNLHLVPKFGYYKDLLEIVLRELEGPEKTQEKLVQIKARNDKVERAKTKSGSRKRPRRPGTGNTRKGGYWDRKGAAARNAKEEGVLQPRDERIAAALKQDKEKSEMASQLRKQIREEMFLRLQSKLKDSPQFAAMYEVITETFAKQLLSDKAALESKKYFDISFAAKWCPSFRKSYDLPTRIHDAIAAHIFGKEDFIHLEDESRALALSLKMRNDFLVPLRKALEIPETYMSANRWTELPYDRVPSVAMTNYVDLFVKHDNDRLMDFLENVVAGKKKVAAGALLPHKVVKEAVREKGKPKGILAESQWKRMVNDLKEGGSKLSSAMAVCDVSGSMSGIPMEVCIALGLLITELSDEPFKNHLCTFSQTPEIQLIEGQTLAERYQFTSSMDWGMNTNFLEVFRLLLDLAKTSKLPKEKMVKRLFVFSDMEFDEASANPWETDYMMITKMYGEAGYGEPPEIIFWNLRDSNSTPVLATQKGVALVSGFSKNLLKVFLDENAELVEEGAVESNEEKQKKPKIDPKEAMHKALTGELFDVLEVVD